MALQRRGCDHSAPKPPSPVDLAALTDLLTKILFQVTDHNQTVNIDLQPAIDKLTKIISALSSLELTVGATTSAVNNLTNLFMTELGKIEDFESEELLVLNSIQSAIVKSDTDLSALLSELTKVKTISRYSYSYNYVVGTTVAHITIPAGAVELTVLTGCYDYKATIGTRETWIDCGDDIVIPFRNTNAGVVVEPAYTLELPVGAKVAISYTALSDIGEPVTDGDVSLYQGKLVIDKNDTVLQQAIDSANSVINQPAA